MKIGVIIKKLRAFIPIASVPQEFKIDFNQLCLKNTINRLKYLFIAVVSLKLITLTSAFFTKRNNLPLKIEDLFTHYDIIDIVILIVFFLLMIYFFRKNKYMISQVICILFIIYNAFFSLLLIPSTQTSIEIQKLINPDLIVSEDKPFSVTVSEAKNFIDDTYVLLHGTIESSLGNERYLFSDHTGSIIIEIDDELFRRSSIDPKSLKLPEQFEIIGEIEEGLTWAGIDKVQLFIFYIVVLLLLPAFRPSVFIPFNILYLLGSLLVLSGGYRAFFIYSHVKLFITSMFVMLFILKLLFYNNNVKSFIMASKLESSIIQQKKAEANRRELIAGISHDLRTPLTSIIVSVEGIKTGVAATQNMQEKYLDYIKNEADNMKHIIEQLFLFSKLDMDDFPLNLIRIDISLAVSEMIEDSLDGYESRGLSIHLAEMPQNVYVMADVRLLRNVLNNIIDNSIKYKVKEHGKMKISACLKNNLIVLRFEDDGPGVEAEKLAKLLDAFYRADPSRSEFGSGLGLAISAKIIQSMGGQMYSELPSSDDDDLGGLAIIIQLPVSEEDKINGRNKKESIDN